MVLTLETRIAAYNEGTFPEENFISSDILFYIESRVGI